jgi:hypothetical protein
MSQMGHQEPPSLTPAAAGLPAAGISALGQHQTSRLFPSTRNSV